MKQYFLVGVQIVVMVMFTVAVMVDSFGPRSSEREMKYKELALKWERAEAECLSKGGEFRDSTCYIKVELENKL